MSQKEEANIESSIPPPSPDVPSFKLQAVDPKLNAALLRAGGFHLLAWGGLVSLELTWDASMAIVGKIAKNLEGLLP